MEFLAIRPEYGCACYIRGISNSKLQHHCILYSAYISSRPLNILTGKTTPPATDRIVLFSWTNDPPTKVSGSRYCTTPPASASRTIHEKMNQSHSPRVNGVNGARVANGRVRSSIDDRASERVNGVVDMVVNGSTNGVVNGAINGVVNGAVNGVRRDAPASNDNHGERYIFNSTLLSFATLFLYHLLSHSSTDNEDSPSARGTEPRRRHSFGGGSTYIAPSVETIDTEAPRRNRPRSARVNGTRRPTVNGRLAAAASSATHGTSPSSIAGHSAARTAEGTVSYNSVDPRDTTIRAEGQGSTLRITGINSLVPARGVAIVSSTVNYYERPESTSSASTQQSHNTSNAHMSLQPSSSQQAASNSLSPSAPPYNNNMWANPATANHWFNVPQGYHGMPNFYGTPNQYWMPNQYGYPYYSVQPFYTGPPYTPHHHFGQVRLSLGSCSVTVMLMCERRRARVPHPVRISSAVVAVSIGKTDATRQSLGGFQDLRCRSSR